MFFARYGWMPSEQDVPSDIAAEYKWVPYTSITHMEVLLGAYRSHNPNSVFFLRDPAGYLEMIPAEARSQFVEPTELGKVQLGFRVNGICLFNRDEELWILNQPVKMSTLILFRCYWQNSLKSFQTCLHAFWKWTLTTAVIHLNSAIYFLSFSQICQHVRHNLSWCLALVPSLTSHQKWVLRLLIQ